jgi:ABC-type polysaccharide/polyol phosphate transport system ATPase subunit
MGDVVIRAEGLGKKYVIGHESTERYSTLRDILAQQGRRLLRSARDMAAGRALIAGDEREEFWALRDVDFEIRRGEVVGIIGRNGAGKSTLLKVLSRITEPTEGRVTIDGRVASLLEVGTGFHPELTGRENIYLNGAILGMTRAEIRRKFDEIVDFAGVEKFLDTPVKRYSSGMYVRLAFSVAAHLEPEILVVDEVLAVGDAEFQKKCLGKMQNVAGEGRTVLFVSHNRAAVSRLCPTAIWMHEGRVRAQGETTALLAEYGRFAAASPQQVEKRKVKGAAFFRGVNIRAAGREPGIILNSDPIQLRFEIELSEPIKELRMSVDICDADGEVIFVTAPADSGLSVQGHVGVQVFLASVPPYTFLPRDYSMRANLWAPAAGKYDLVDNVPIQVEMAPESLHNVDRRLGKVFVPCSWTSEVESSQSEMKAQGWVDV